MGVIADGSYGVEPGLMFSYPLTIKDKKWSIVQHLSISPFAREKLDATAAELKEELQAAMDECADWLHFSDLAARYSKPANKLW